MGDETVVVDRVTGLRATMDDGVELVADAWVPRGDGRWPVLLQRLPYGRSVASTPALPHPSWFARHGYAVVVQDCRGRGESGGVFRPFVDEGPDGAATVEWAGRLPFADGRVAMYGFSYQGLGQLYAAARRPPSLRAIAPMMCAADPYEGWTYEHGLLRWPFVCFWAAQLAGQEHRRGPVPFDLQALPRTAALGPEPPPWFREWLAHPTDDHYWAERRPDLDAIDVPAFTALGWFDDFSSANATLIDRLGAVAWCGPWGHMPWGTRHGGVDFGQAAAPSAVWDALVAFFDRVFDRPSPAPAHRVTYYVLGEGWRESESWPPLHEPRRWVGRGGHAQSRWGDGHLGPADGVDDPSEAADPVVATTLVADPWYPYPGDPFDHQDESAAEDRRDVACYTSDPLRAPLTLAGAPRVVIVTKSDVPAHDLVVSLCVVDDDRSSRLLSGSGARLLEGRTPGEAVRWEIVLRPFAAHLPTSSRLRVDVSLARFPCFDRHAHGERHDGGAGADQHRVATVEIRELEIELPVVQS